MAIKQYTVRQGQTIFDLALQLYGDVTKTLAICKLNTTTIPNLLSRNLAGRTINYEEQNNSTVNEFSKNGTIISTQYPEYTTGVSAWSFSFSTSFVTPPTT